MYESLFKRHKEHHPKSVFAHFGWRSDIGETWETPFQKLADKAKIELWDFGNIEFKKAGTTYPILSSYLNYTFLRVQQQAKIKYSPDGDRACINTGLQTPEGKDIYATFYKNKEATAKNQPNWSLFGYFDAYSDKVKDFEPLPDIATYIDEPSELVFDHNYEFEVNYEHILKDNIDRLPIRHWLETR